MAAQDPYTAKASTNAPLETKISEVKEILGKVSTAMLTTRTTDGALHSRAMAPASHKGLEFEFFANNESGKVDDVEKDGAANVSFYDPSSTDWVSVSGTASVSNSTPKIKELYNPALKAWFGDLGDGKHDGGPDDPRVSLITVTPTEIRYWKVNKGTVGRAVEIAKGAITGDTAAPGTLKVLNEQDLKSARSRSA